MENKFKKIFTELKNELETKKKSSWFNDYVEKVLETLTNSGLNKIVPFEKEELLAIYGSDDNQILDTDGIEYYVNAAKIEGNNGYKVVDLRRLQFLLPTNRDSWCDDYWWCDVGGRCEELNYENVSQWLTGLEEYFDFEMKHNKEFKKKKTR